MQPTEATNLEVWRSALPALRELNRRAIPVIVWKSLPQVEDLYGNLEARLTMDVDLVVRGVDVVAAFEALQAAGFRPKSGGHYPDFERYSARSGREAALRQRSWTLVPANGGHDIDLHNDGIDPWRSAALRPHIWQRAEERERDGVHFLVVGAEDRLIALAYGVARDGWLVHKLADVAAALRAPGQLDWQYIDRRSLGLGLFVITRGVACAAAQIHHSAPSIAPGRSERMGLLRRPVLAAALCGLHSTPPGFPALAALILAHDHPLRDWLPALRAWTRDRRSPYPR